MTYLYLALLALAAARATHLVADDLFPFGGLRDWLNTRYDNSRDSNSQPLGVRLANWLGQGIGCTFCVSVWAGAAAAGLATYAGWVDFSVPAFAVLWFAYAQAIILIEATVVKLMDL